MGGGVDVIGFKVLRHGWYWWCVWWPAMLSYVRGGVAASKIRTLFAGNGGGDGKTVRGHGRSIKLGIWWGSIVIGAISDTVGARRYRWI